MADMMSIFSWTRLVLLILHPLLGLTDVGPLPVLLLTGTRKGIEEACDDMAHDNMVLATLSHARAPRLFLIWGYLESSMVALQYCVTFMFFVLTIRTEHFRVRACQFVTIIQAILPVIPWYDHTYWGFGLDGSIMIQFGILTLIYAVLGFGPYRPDFEVPPPTSDSRGQGLVLVMLKNNGFICCSWARGFWVWLWSIQCMLLGFAYRLSPGVNSFDAAVGVAYNMTVSQLPNGKADLPDTVPDSGKWIFQQLFSFNFMFCAALLFFLATVRTEHFRVRCCQLLCLDLGLLTPYYYLSGYYRFGLAMKDAAYCDMFCAAIFFLFGFLGPCICKSTVAEGRVSLAVGDSAEDRKANLSESLIIKPTIDEPQGTWVVP